MSRFNSFRATLALVAVCTLIVGCSKPAPDDMPETVPFTVKVVNGSKGIADVQVVMENPTGTGAVSGKTNSSGVAEMKTTYKNFTAKGAPVGEYKVRCLKDPVVDHWKTQEEINAMDLGERQAYFDEWAAKCKELPREVPEILNEYDACPCSTKVEAGGQYVIDVSEYEDKK